MAASDEAASLLNQLGVMQQMIEQKMQSLQKLRARTEDSTSDLLWKERNDSEVQIHLQAVHLLSFNSSITGERPLPRYSCSTSCFNQCFCPWAYLCIEVTLLVLFTKKAPRLKSVILFLPR